MCTSIEFKKKDFYFGRNMDIDCSFGERVVITPRNYGFKLTNGESIASHFAFIGMATVMNDYPLYADAVNEKGLCIAGLNFPDNAFYHAVGEVDGIGISPYELIPWLMSRCETAVQAKQFLEKAVLVNIPFNDELPLAELHWHIADRNNSFVLESTRTGLNIYENPVGVLANNPTFDFHMQNLSQYLNLTAGKPCGAFTDVAGITEFGKGTGSIGLPGDFSSASRFVRSAYLRHISVCGDTQEECVSQLFHMLDSCAVVNGSIKTTENQYKTTYSCCVNSDKGVYYYKTYNNSMLRAVDMTKENLDSSKLIQYSVTDTQHFSYEN